MGEINFVVLGAGAFILAAIAAVAARLVERALRRRE